MANKIAQLHDNIDKTRNYVLQRENVLGRSPDCNLFFDNKRVSRRHARIATTPRSDAYYIEDICARGVYVNFKRVRGRHPLKEADRICILQFHNVHPLELQRMRPEDLKACCDDPRNRGIQSVVDLTFGYVDEAEVAEQAAAPADAAAAEEERPKGVLARLKDLLHTEKPKAPRRRPKRGEKPEEWKSTRPDRYKL